MDAPVHGWSMFLNRRGLTLYNIFRTILDPESVLYIYGLIDVGQSLILKKTNFGVRVGAIALSLYTYMPGYICLLNGPSMKGYSMKGNKLTDYFSLSKALYKTLYAY